MCDDAVVVNGPRISVLIPAYNEQDLIAATIDSVHRSFSEIGCDSYEIVVCDNNSTDRTAELARAARAQVVFEPHNQIARARNSAAKAATGQWFIFLDADTQLNPATLRATITALESGWTGAGGSVMWLDSDRLGSGQRMLLQIWNALSRTFRWAAGSFIFCQREAWLETGGFDERVYASEEVWFSRDLKRWCRANDRAFTILSTSPVITSARKMEWYTPWQIFKQFTILSVPGAWRKREKCATWYTRPLPRSND